MPHVETGSGRIFYADDDFVDPWCPHETVFLQPWLLGNHTRFRTWVPILAGEYRVIRMDRRALGKSDAPPPDFVPTLDSIMEEFIVVLDAIGVDRVHFVGESTGGLFGIAFAATHPERVRSLVLCATPTALASTALGLAVDPHPDGASSVMAMGSKAYARVLALRAAAGAQNESEVLERFEQIGSIPPYAVASLVRMVTDPALDVASLLPKIEAPTLLLTPGGSAVLDRAGQKRMRTSIPYCEQVIFEGAPHTIFFDQRARCQAETLRFIRSAAGAAPGR